MRKLILFLFTAWNAGQAAAQVPVLNSRSEATAVLYLDFDGHSDNSGYWDNWGYSNPIVTAPSGRNATQITEVFTRVAEDFSIFNINVTTSQTVYDNAPSNRRQRVVITPTDNFYNNSTRGGSVAGGVAYYSTFRGGEIACYVFENRLSNSPKNIAEAASHELGHTLGLQHQAKYNSSCNKTAEYHSGTSATGQTGWAPLMGVGYSRNVTTWYHGPGSASTCSAGNQDDLAVISASANGFGYAMDDNNTTVINALNLSFATYNINQTGIIKSASELDYYKFAAPGSNPVVFFAIPSSINGTDGNYGDGHSGANLDLNIRLYNSTGTTLLAESTDNARLDAQFSYTLTGGTQYILRVDGEGLSNYQDIGFKSSTDYGSLGRYRMLTLQPGQLASGNQSISSGAVPNTIHFSGNPSAGSYQWYYQNGIVSTPSMLDGTTGWTAVSGATGSSYTPPSLTASRTYACRITYRGMSAWASGVRQITIGSGPAPDGNYGTVAAGNQTICNAGDPDNITFSTAATAGSTYQWYYQNSIIAAPAPTAAVTGWTSISGATSSSYDPPAGLTASRTYACRVTNGQNSQWAAGVRQVTVLPAFSPGTVTAGDETFCGSGNPSNITLSTNPVGSGAYQWRWYFRETANGNCPTGGTIPSGWNTNNTSPNITGTTTTGAGINFDPTVAGTVGNGRTFAVLITPVANGSIPACGTPQWASNCRKTFVNNCSTFTPGTVAAGNQTVCNAGDPDNISFSTAATAGSTFQWYYQNGIIAAPANTAAVTGWTSIGGATSSGYNPPAGLTASRTYACRVSSGQNSQWATGVRQVTVLPAFSPGTIASGNQSGCTEYNPDPVTLSVNPSGGSGLYNYRWYYWASTSMTCPTGNAVPSGSTTSSSDSRFFGTWPGSAISFDPTSSGAAPGRTWAVLITPVANGSIPACGTPAFASSCRRTAKIACREGEEEIAAEELREEYEAEATLAQNNPNPFDQETRIACFIPKGVQTARILVFGIDGRLVEELPVRGSGQQFVTFKKGLLSPGVYLYSLVLDGQQRAVRKMVVGH